MATWNLLNADDPVLARTAIGAAAGGGINVKDYEAVGNGVTDDVVAIQNAINAAAANASAGTGPTEVFIPAGVWIASSVLTIGAGVTLRGAGMAATIIESTFVTTGANASVVELTGASDITVSDLTVQSAGTGTHSLGITANYATGLQENVTIARCRVTGTTNTAVRFSYAIKGATFTDNLIDDCTFGFAMYAPLLATGLTSSQILISRNRFRDVGTVNIQLYGGNNSPGVSTVVDVEISDNSLREFKQFGPAGPIPIEPTEVTNIRIANNVIEGTSTRGISTGNNVNMTCTGNAIRGQSIYAFELNGGRQITIVGNVVEDCATFVMQTGGGVPLSDVVIANNTYVGSGLSSTEAIDAIRITTGRRVRISGNIFADWEYIRTAIRIGNAESPTPVDCVIEGNTFVASDANTPLNAINIRSGIRTNIVRNAFRIHRDLVAGDAYVSVIQATMVADVTDTLIEGNHIMFTGAVGAAADAHGVGNQLAGGAACVGLTVRRNHVTGAPRGLRISTTSTDLKVDGNDTNTCVAADTIPATAITPSKTSYLEFPNVLTQSYSDLTITVPGAATGDSVALGVPTASVAAGIAYTAWVSAADTVTVRAHNYSAGGVNPANGLFKATIIDSAPW